MSPLTPDERAEAVEMLRERGQSVLHPDPRALDLADRLEAEPEPLTGSIRHDVTASTPSLCCGRSPYRVNDGPWRCGCGKDVQPVFADYVPLRERDAARSELADVRTHLEDARLAVEGVMGGSVPPDWSIADLAEDVARIAQREYHGRVEALEALRGAAACLRDARFMAHSTEEHAALTERTDAALRRAAELLEGVERTHTLVPNAVVEKAAWFARCRAKSPVGVDANCDAKLWEERFLAAARGVHVDWPGDNA